MSNTPLTEVTMTEKYLKWTLLVKVHSEKFQTEMENYMAKSKEGK